jgi:hypothetical protein
MHSHVKGTYYCFKILIRSNWKVHVSIISSPILIYELNFGIYSLFFHRIDGISENGGKIPSNTKEKKMIPKEFVCNETIDGAKTVISIFSCPFLFLPFYTVNFLSSVIVRRILKVRL